MPKNDTPRPLDPAAVAACGDYAKYGFEPKRRHGADGVQLVVDDNFRIFCVPHLRTMDFSLIGHHGKIMTHGLVINAPGQDSFRKAVKACAEHLSALGTMCTYGSINLTSRTGVGRVD